MIRVLHVDDDEEFADLVAQFLERENDEFDVETVPNPEVAVARLSDGDIDCIVSDYEMPETDGIEFLVAVREDYPSIPFILFTAQGSEEIASTAISAGVTDYLQKGTGRDQYTLLANRIENAVEQYRSQQRLDRYEERLEELLSDSHDIIAVVDPEGVIQYISPAVHRLLGYTVDDLVGERVTEYIHPDDVGAIEDLLEDDDRDELRRCEYRLRAADDSWRWMESIGRDQRRGVVDGYVLNTRDITERKSTEERFQALVEQSTDVITVIDPDGEIGYASSSIEDVTGVPPAEIEGENALDHVHPEDIAAVQEALERVLSDPAASPVVEHRFATDDGSWRWLESTGSNQLDTPGIEGIVVNARDITARKRQSRKVGRYETLLESLPVGVLVLDEEARVEWINEAFWTAIDATEDELLGRPFMELVEAGLVEEEIVEKYLDAVRTLLSSESDADAVDIEFEIDPPHEPGIREYEGYIALRRLVDGEYRGTVNAFIDVTDRKARERELEQYEAAVETVPDGVFLLDETGVMTRVNQAWADIVGYDPAELNGEPFEMLVEDGVIDHRVVETYLDLLPELLASDSDRERAKFLTRVVPPTDDREHVYEVHVGLLPFDEAFRGTASVVRDVTEKVDRQRELERENERLDEFASIVSHDLRNPLTVATGSLDMAERTGDPEHFRQARDALDRMGRLITDLLDLARQGEDIDTIETVDLAEVVETCWETIETNWTTLRTETDLTLDADEARLEQLVENLLANAIEHGGDTVTITVGDLENGTGFYIADDGAGIPDEVGGEVFERGYSTNGGTGVGLNIVEGIAEAHGWSVKLVESDGGGARFEFDIRDAARTPAPQSGTV